jgi:hypothetical protein
MSAIFKFVAPIELSFLSAGNSSLFDHLGEKPIQLSPIREPEERLWKLSARAVSSKFAFIELFMLVVFLAVALVETISCFGELSHLLQNDAVWRVVLTAVAGGG